MAVRFLVLLVCVLCVRVQAQFGKKVVANVHLAVTHEDDQMMVSWWSNEPSGSTCWYGPGLSLSTSGYQTVYDGFKAGYNHNVLLKGLSYDTVYPYQCGDKAFALSEQYQFRTRNASIGEFNFGVYGDLGVEHSQETMDSLKIAAADRNWGFIWHLGDISYANDHINFEGVWNDWFQRLEQPLASVPYMVSPGNHEKWSRDPILHQGSRNFSAFEHKFRMPAPDGTNTSLFYSFDFGPVHVVSINTESGYVGYPVDPEPTDPNTQNPTGYNTPHPADDITQTNYLQMNWLEDDLAKANANRDKVPWIFVGGHRPVYEVEVQKDNHPKGTSARLQEWLEPVFTKYGVDIFFAGHEHHYTRNWPVLNNEVTQFNYSYPDVTTYLIHGAAGNIEGHGGIAEEKPTWYATGDDEYYGYGEITIFNATHLRWRAYASETRDVIDEIILSRKR